MQIPDIKRLSKKYRVAEEEINLLAQSHLVPENARMARNGMVLGPAGVRRLVQLLEARQEQKKQGRSSKRRSASAQTASGALGQLPAPDPATAYRAEVTNWPPVMGRAWRAGKIGGMPGWSYPRYPRPVQMWFPGMPTSLPSWGVSPPYYYRYGPGWSSPRLFPGYRWRGRNAYCLRPRYPIGAGPGSFPEGRPWGGSPTEMPWPPPGGFPGFRPPASEYAAAADSSFPTPEVPKEYQEQFTRQGYVAVPGYEHLMPPAQGRELTQEEMKQGYVVVPGYEHLMPPPPAAGQEQTNHDRVAPAEELPASSSGPTRAKSELATRVQAFPAPRESHHNEKEGTVMSQSESKTDSWALAPPAGEAEALPQMLQTETEAAVEPAQTEPEWKSLPWPLCAWARLRDEASQVSANLAENQPALKDIEAPASQPVEAPVVEETGPAVVVEDEVPTSLTGPGAVTEDEEKEAGALVELATVPEVPDAGAETGEPEPAGPAPAGELAAEDAVAGEEDGSARQRMKAERRRQKRIGRWRICPRSRR